MKKKQCAVVQDERLLPIKRCAAKPLLPACEGAQWRDQAGRGIVTVTQRSGAGAVVTFTLRAVAHPSPCNARPCQIGRVESASRVSL